MTPENMQKLIDWLLEVIKETKIEQDKLPIEHIVDIHRLAASRRTCKETLLKISLLLQEEDEPCVGKIGLIRDRCKDTDE